MPCRSRLLPLVLATSLLLGCGAALAAGDAGACRYVPVAKLPLVFGRSPLPLVTGSLQGEPATLLVDTGAYTTLLTRTGVERLGIPIHASGNYTSGVGGNAVVYAARLRDFAIGPVHSGPIVLPVLGNSTKLPFDAIFGADSMRKLDMELALKEKFVQFFEPNGCDDTFLAYWDKDAMEIPFGGTEMEPNKPRFIVELNGKKLEAMIDSGATTTAVTREVAERMGLRLDSPDAPKAGYAVGAGDAKSATWWANFDSLVIGSETIRNARLGILDMPPQGDRGHADIVFGDDFLRAHRVLFANSQKRLYISYLGGEVFTRRAAPER